MNNNGKKRIYYRPNKASGIIGGVIGGIFVLIGIFFAIPVFGAFGIAWTLIAALIAGVSLYQAFGKKSDGSAPFSPEIIIEDVPVSDADPAKPGRSAVDSGDVEARLIKLQDLYDRRVISREEYDEKRRDILGEL